ncbi:MAG: hypothetical protein QGD94_12750, partial [Planctomycetia bacterium]|nr:hypothetical protein [Planctomycetia bacterium]
MTFHPSGRDTPFEQYSMKVTVEAGKTTYVVGRLPWRKGRELASWTPRALVGRRYGRLQTALQPGTIFCAIQADDKAIRVVWDNQADIWSAVSTDGKTFSLPRKLPIPVSTGWREGSVRFWRDESGRFMLTFRSDRDRRHVGLLYVSWSRDFVHWSAPVAMLDQRVDQYDVFQDDRGRFILAVVDRGGGYTVKTTSEKNEQNIIIFASRDAYRWEKLVTIPEHRFRWTREIQMLQRDDGKYELFVVKRPVLHNEPFMGGPDGKTPMLRITRSDGTSEARKVPHPEDWEPERIWRWEAEGNTEVWRFLSNDAKTWDQGVRITS